MQMLDFTCILKDETLGAYISALYGNNCLPYSALMLSAFLFYFPETFKQVSMLLFGKTKYLNLKTHCLYKLNL